MVAPDFQDNSLSHEPPPPTPAFTLPSGDVAPPGYLPEGPKRRRFRLLRWWPFVLIGLGLLGWGGCAYVEFHTKVVYALWLGDLQRDGIIHRSPVKLAERTGKLLEITFPLEKMVALESGATIANLEGANLTVSRLDAFRDHFEKGAAHIKSVQMNPDFTGKIQVTSARLPQTIEIGSLSFGPPGSDNDQKHDLAVMPIRIYPRAPANTILAQGNLVRDRSYNQVLGAFSLWREPDGLVLKLTDVDARSWMVAALAQVFDDSKALSPLEIKSAPERLDSASREARFQGGQAKAAYREGALVLEEPLIFGSGTWMLSLQRDSRISTGGHYELYAKFTGSEQLTTALIQKVEDALRDNATRAGSPATGDLHGLAEILLADQLHDGKWTVRFHLTGQLQDEVPPDIERIPLEDPQETMAEEAAKIDAVSQ